MILYQLFPWHRTGTPHAHAEQELKSLQQQNNVDALATAVANAKNQDVLKGLRDVAISKMKSEDDRQASIMSRAQALFAALAFFGFVLAFGVTLLTTSSVVSRARMVVCILFASYVVTQVMIMMLNILNAIRGIGARAAGSSDLASWVGMDNTADFYRAQALLDLDHYRWHSLTNTWRFMQLESSLIGFRNIVVSLSLFAVTLFAFAILKPETTLLAGPPVKALAADSPLVGAWQLDAGQAAQGLYLFTPTRYSMLLVTTNRPDLPDTNKASADELRALWGPMLANSGSYEISGDLITIHPVAAKIPVVMKPGATEVYQFKIEGKTLTLKQVWNARGVAVESAQTLKFVRVE